MDDATKKKLEAMVLQLSAEDEVALHNALDTLVNVFGIQRVIYQLGAVTISNYAHMRHHEEDELDHYLNLTADEWGFISNKIAEVDEAIIHKLDEDIPF